MKLTKKLRREIEDQAMYQTPEEMQGVKDTIALITDNFTKANSREWEKLFGWLGTVQEIVREQEAKNK